MSPEISIVLVDDHTIVRNGLKSLIEVMGNFKVVAQFDNGREFADGIGKIPPPDLIVMDLNMPVMNGLETMRWMRRHKIGLKVMILTLDTDEQTIIQLYRTGVRGYLAKNCTAEVLREAIEDIVYTGYYHSEMVQKALDSGVNYAKPKAIAAVTDRELHFLTLVCNDEEYTYEQMANIMNVHRRTIDGYRDALFKKFDVRSKTGLVLFAIKHGITKV
ncbi:MAG: response regulator transcription factor [Bacteroidota bacterium]